MNMLLIVLGILALIGILAVAFRPLHARPPHFTDQDADGSPDLTETERRDALREATERVKRSTQP